MIVETLIIGAGVSGLAYALNEKKDFLILEKEATPGGLCRTFYKDGFVWDYAGHFFHFANSDIKAFFEKEISPEDMVKCLKKTNIYYNDTIVDYPFQMNIHQLSKEEFIDCLYDLFHRDEKTCYNSFQDMLYGKFGKSITQKFLKPYNEKLYACDLNELDVDAMGRFFPYADPSDIIDNMKKKISNSYNNSFDYPKRGAQFFIDILCRNIPKERISLNSAVEYINPSEKEVVVNGRTIKYRRLVNTIPLNRFLELLPNEYRSPLGTNLTCNKVLVFNLGFDKPSLDKSVHWTYFPDKSINFYRAGYYNNILGNEKLSMYIEIGYKEHDYVDIEKQLSLTIDNLRKTGIIKDHNLVAYNSIIINPGYVHITKKSSEQVLKYKDYLSKYDIYSIGRYGGWTYCSIEDCMIEAIKLASNS